MVAHDIGPVGGMERQLTELISGCRERGVPVTVISRTCDIPGRPGIRHVRVRGPRRPFPLAYPWFMCLASILVWRHRKGRLVHSTGAIVLNRVDVCAVHFCHHAWARSAGMLRVRRNSRGYRLNAACSARLSRLGERLFYRQGRARRFAAVSGGVAREMKDAFPAIASSIVVAPNGVDVDRFAPCPRRAIGDVRASRFTVLFVGSEWHAKGLRHVIEALPAAPRWRLVVVGEGDERELAGVAGRLGVGDRVEFLGRQEEPEALYRAADAFALPSVYETFSLVTYEAAASGLPLLVTKVSGVEDILEDGVNGWFVEPSAGSISARLNELSANSDLRERMGIAARAASLHYSWENMLDAHLRLLEEAGR